MSVKNGKRKRRNEVRIHETAVGKKEKKSKQRRE